MKSTNDEPNKEKIPCESEEIYRAINKVRRKIKNKAEKTKTTLRNKSEGWKPSIKKKKNKKSVDEYEQDDLILLAYMNDAVKDTYYSIAGFRYYAENLYTYVMTVMPEDELKENVFIFAYNSCIHYMTSLYEKLERKLDKYNDQRKTKETFTNDLLSEMKRFTDLSRELKLDKPDDFSSEEYKSALKKYSEQIKTELTDKYKSEGEEV